MILIDGPYVSDFLKETLYRNQFEVVRTKAAESFLDLKRTHFISGNDARDKLENHPDTLVYTNSENALDWLYRECPGSALVKTVQLLKDKVQFRETLMRLHPDYHFSGHAFEDLAQINPATLTFPLILKPSVGFFSLGVQRLENQTEWTCALARLAETIRDSTGLYPRGVLNHSVFIIEEIIPGDELAVDCYFDAQGNPVVLNLMQHLFASPSHMNDRIYFTSGQVIIKFHQMVTAYLRELGTVFGLRNFPAHIEVRIQGDHVQAIEVNPLRFGGWCSTPDIAKYAWDMNLYEAVLEGYKPDWAQLAAANMEGLYALLVLDNSTGVPGQRIKAFDYEGLLKKVRKPLELRKTNFARFPTFGFLMCRVPAASLDDLDELLRSDLSEFITL